MRSATVTNRTPRKAVFLSITSEKILFSSIASFFVLLLFSFPNINQKRKPGKYIMILYIPKPFTNNTCLDVQITERNCSGLATAASLLDACLSFFNLFLVYNFFTHKAARLYIKSATNRAATWPVYLKTKSTGASANDLGTCLWTWQISSNLQLYVDFIFLAGWPGRDKYLHHLTQSFTRAWVFLLSATLVGSKISTIQRWSTFVGGPLILLNKGDSYGPQRTEVKPTLSGHQQSFYWPVF